MGTKAKVESIDGTRTQIYIPNGVQSGETIEIPNKGYKNAKGESLGENYQIAFKESDEQKIDEALSRKNKRKL